MPRNREFRTNPTHPVALPRVQPIPQMHFRLSWCAAPAEHYGDYVDAVYPQTMAVGMIIAYFVMLFMSMTAHEYAHAWTAFRAGDTTAAAHRLSENAV